MRIKIILLVLCFIIYTISMNGHDDKCWVADSPCTFHTLALLQDGTFWS